MTLLSSGGGRQTRIAVSPVTAAASPWYAKYAVDVKVTKIFLSQNISYIQFKIHKMEKKEVL